MPDHDADFGTTIGPDASFSGKLQFEKGAKVLGTFEGEITTKGQLQIAGSGKLAGEAHAGNIRVEGQVKGNLHAAGKIQLTESARLEGDIEATKLEVAEGAVLIGRCAVGAKAEDRAATPIKTAAAPADRVRNPRADALTAEAAAPVGR